MYALKTSYPVVSLIFDLENFNLEKQIQPDKIDCPDCKGTGKYQGLNKMETCKTCSGYGYLVRKECCKNSNKDKCDNKCNKDHCND
ncbi:MAG: hypothetical protein ABIJ08_04110 [Nanoarchaeota archaeon]